MDAHESLQQRIKELTGWRIVRPPRLVTDTSDCMRIQRGDVVRLDGREFVIEGNRHETRFGIDDQPKYWVFSAIDLETGRRYILKTVFHEDFNVHIGVFKIRCYRSPEKESEVLDLVRGDDRFMQGYTVRDEAGNNVRILDFISGPSIFQHIYHSDLTHEEYFHSDLPGILHRLTGCMEAIAFLHDHDFCHGDIRNDHIMIDSETDRYRWIDFDLNQHVIDFDVWSMGNIINYAVGKGIRSFHTVMRDDRFSEAVKNSLTKQDGSAFYEYRIINLKKLFGYIPRRLNEILMHFAVEPIGHYANMVELMLDYQDMLETDFPRNSEAT